eukprot:CAMPEP_0115569750 /NCGR_PEP_ID=MMETSP0271-20121206/105350_1 /TAXON_ID=71861 /ORGANISM="Scrippsiella trochoidea, Strain CCMP3099" /LENGTH=123 /DNA_ID=CAMNT_0003004277 /DNA_START=198 /DNA_END=566 /DNA_ORIENTATION=-
MLPSVKPGGAFGNDIPPKTKRGDHIIHAADSSAPTMLEARSAAAVAAATFMLELVQTGAHGACDRLCPGGLDLQRAELRRDLPSMRSARGLWSHQWPSMRRRSLCMTTCALTKLPLPAVVCNG